MDSQSFSILVPFYFCKIFLCLPLSVSSSPEMKIFQISAFNAIGILLLLCCNFIYIDATYDALSLCRLLHKCAPAYLAIVEACYSFGLLLITLFLKPLELVELFNEFNAIANLSSNSGTLIRVLIFYTFVCLQFVRNFMFYNNTKLIMWVFKIIVQNVQYTIDGLIVSFCLILAASFKELSTNLKEDKTNLKNVVCSYWDRGTLLRKVDKCFGPLLVVVTVFKLLQILGLIYFYFLSKTYYGWLQSFDICLPTLNFVLICYCCDRVSLEVRNLLKTIESMYKDNFGIKEETEIFLRLNEMRTLSITGSSFFTMDVDLLFKITSVVFTYAVTMMQF